MSPQVPVSLTPKEFTLPQVRPLTRILLYSEEPFLAAGLSAVLNQSSEFEVLPVVDSISGIADEDPDIILIDLAAATNYAVLEQLAQSCGDAKLLIWTNEISTELAFQAMNLGVKGILRKRLPAAFQLECITRVAGGELWFEKTLTDRFLRSRRVALSPQEGRVVSLVSQGMKNKEIGAALNLQEGTVKVYLSKLFLKVGVKDRLELALYGLRNLTPDSQQPPPGGIMPGLKSLVLEAPSGDRIPPAPSGTVRSWRGETAA